MHGSVRLWAGEIPITIRRALDVISFIDEALRQIFDKEIEDKVEHGVVHTFQKGCVVLRFGADYRTQPRPIDTNLSSYLGILNSLFEHAQPVLIGVRTFILNLALNVIVNDYLKYDLSKCSAIPLIQAIECIKYGFEEVDEVLILLSVDGHSGA